VLRARGKVLYAISPESVAPSIGFAKLTRRKFAVDFFEDYLRLLQDRAWANRFFGIVGWIAKSDTRSALWFAKRADLTTVADVQVPPFDARNRLVVRNLPDLTLLTHSGERGERPRAIYIGDLRKSRGLYTMLEVARMASDWEFDFVGEVAPSDREYVENWLLEKNLQGTGDKGTGDQGTGSSTSRIRFHGRLAPQESWKLAAGAWVGLSLLESTPAFVEAVPSKLYEYMSVGLPVISTPLPRCVDLIEASQSGAIAATPEEIVELLHNWRNNPEKLDNFRRQGEKWAKEHLDSEQEYRLFAAEMAKLTR
jgi:glycosyltransferase involved in cell wall biosynthesis